MQVRKGNADRVIQYLVDREGVAEVLASLIRACEEKKLTDLVSELKDVHAGYTFEL